MSKTSNDSAQSSPVARNEDSSTAPALTSASSSTDKQSEASKPTPTKKRTRATAEQLAVLEDTFAVNVSPNSKLRKQLAERLQMSERSIQIWFQNRRAKVKHMQKRAQMQMQQASIRAQLYHYHQQQYGSHPYGSGPPLMPLQPQQQPYYRPYPPPAVARVPLPRAQSVDNTQQTATPPPYYPQNVWPDASSPSTPTSHPFTNNSTIPTLVPVPDAGPTAMLTTSDFSYAPTTPAATPPAPTPMANDLWCSPDELERAQSVGLAVSDPTTGELVSPVRALSDPIVTTIDPSSLMMTPPASTSSASSQSSHEQELEQQQQNTSLNATTLTIGSWHRLKLRANDLLCVYQPERRMFAWHIADNGSLFRMEISLDAVASIEYIAGECDVLADVHFDISEPPQFYMEQQKDWVQCSDFTEGKQASRFFRHSLKGVAHHMKQELLNLMDKHEETRRLVRFIETPVPTALTAAYQPIEEPMLHQQPYMYWNQMAFMNEPCGFLS
ncbi:hypothetical protein BJV82DRAFT_672076 [Fennellomyces sp. T-0311]|nr:hypothetical protein BJV82DRAFT_672076 [Fennellomyces sp. T-0311]